MGKGALCWFLATVFLFALLECLPGDAATQQVGKAGELAVQARRQEMGLDRPLPVRYGQWLVGLFTGDLGKTYGTQKPIAEMVRVPILSSLTVAALVMLGLLLITLPLAVYCGERRTKWTRLLNRLSVVLSSIPEFILTIFLLLFLAVQARWLPVLSTPGPGETVWTRPLSLVMPTLCLWLISSVSMFRSLRVMVETYARTAYVREARLAGLSRPRVLFVHLLPSALGGIAQLFASTFPYLMGGAMIVESATSFPGMGYTLVSAVQSRETLLVMTLGSLLILVALLSYALADRFGTVSERRRPQ